MVVRRRNLYIFLFLSLVAVGVALGWSEPKILSQVEDSSDDNDGGPSTVSEGETIDVEKSDLVMTSRYPWRPPQFENQEQALGWSPEVFRVPAGMEARVNFWRDIYTTYNTDQGLLHDSQHVSVIYESLDFRPIMNDPILSDRQKRKARRKLVEGKKKEIRDRLGKLAKVTSPESLVGEDLRLWNMFAGIDEKDKFRKAMHRKRLRFQLGQSDRFLQGIYYSGRYLSEMERVFREKGLPVELTRLPFVESSFNVKARSRVGASGIWQFMRYTGRRFLRIHGSVDERNDPVRATEAAARLMRLNFEMLQKWPLAVTGYNHGPAGVQRIVRKFNTDDIVELVDERNGRFGFASANFYACFLAALEVERNARKYFGDKLFWDSALASREIRLPKNINRKVLLKWFDGDTERAKEWNPHILRTFWSGYGALTNKDFVRVPLEKFEMAQQDLSSLPARSQSLGDDIAEKGSYYLIGQGETLSEISNQLGVSVHILKELNGIDNPRSIRAGQKLLIPTGKKQ